MWDDSDTQGVIKRMHVHQAQVRAAAREAASAAQRVSVGRIEQAVDAGASAVAGGEFAAAFHDVGVALQSRVRALSAAVEGWASDVRYAADTFELVDMDAADRLQRTTWRAV